MQGGRTAGEDDAGDGAFAKADSRGGWGTGGHQKRTKEVGEVGIVADDEKIFAFGALAEHLLEVFEGALGGERVGVHDRGFVAGFGADERGGLEATLEWT